MLLLANIEKQILMINDIGCGYENGVTCSILSITTDRGVLRPFAMVKLAVRNSKAKRHGCTGQLSSFHIPWT